MSAIWKRLEEKEEGFTLIELLVVVIIIGILAAIAIPVFLNQRESAWVSSVESDLRNAAIQMETAYTEADPAAYPAALPAEVQTSEGVTIAAPVLSEADQRFCLQATHANLTDAGDTWIYDSGAGGLGDRGDTC